MPAARPRQYCRRYRQYCTGRAEDSATREGGRAETIARPEMPQNDSPRYRLMMGYRLRAAIMGDAEWTPTAPRS